MKSSKLTQFLQFSINNRMPVLIKGKPGIGKSDIVVQASVLANAELIISHPVVSDPTDYKGLPFAINGEADFLPFGMLKRLIDATVPTVLFLDDLGQASPSVQAACMQLILARRINGHKVSDFVTFIAATNRREDKAAVGGLLEPVKSRFASIVELEVDTEDWCKWALTHNMPTELVSFIRFRPRLLDDFKPTRDLINSPSPRTVAAVGNMYREGLPVDLEYEVFSGAAGEAFAVEFMSFLQIWRELPSVDQIILNPMGVDIPSSPAVLYATSGALGERMNTTNVGAIMQYINRMPSEMAVATVKTAATKNPSVCATRPFIEWATANANFIM